MLSVCSKLATCALFTACTLPAAAVEVRILSQAECSRSLVYLGDISEITDVDADRQAELEGIALFPAPVQGSVRQLPLRELQDLLALRSIDMSDCYFYGASSTTIRSSVPEVAVERMPRAEDLRPAAETRLSQAIIDYLEVVTGAESEWKVELSVAQAYASEFVQPGTQIVISGGAAPWRGRQSFQVTLLKGIGSAEVGSAEYAIDAQVKSLVPAVVAVQSLSRGQRITGADVQLASCEVEDGQQTLVIAPEDIVGLELTTNVPAGRPLRPGDLRPPRLVLRNDFVTLQVRRAGVTVRTAVKALDDGAEGDMIEVQSLTSRERFLGRVVGPRLVELAEQSQ